MPASALTVKHVEVTPDSSVPRPTREPIPSMPPPWTCRATVYSVFYRTSPATLPPPDKAYSPLERGATFADPCRSGRAVGGLSILQVIRYADSPAGPYDEMVVVPGYFEYPSPGAAGGAAGDAVAETNSARRGNKKNKKNTAPRVTRIYVSQRVTAWNGRKNWNVPKHLARFEWTTFSDDSLRLRVFPHDFVAPTDATATNTTTAYDPSEATPSTVPFFQCVLQAPRGPLGWIPRFPMSTAAARYVGFDLHICQPPLPAGEGAQGELAGTEQWSRVFPYQYSSRTSLVWVGMDQGLVEDGEDGDREGEGRGDGQGKGQSPGQGEGLRGEGKEKKRYVDEYKNFLPGLGRWMLGMKMDDAVIKLDIPETWDSSL